MTGDRVRDEAERLVAAAIAAVSLAARGMGAAGRAGSGFATGSPECCVCPVCRLISSMRDPSADIAERLASGAGDLATGVASMLRALGRGGHGTSHDEGDTGREGDAFWESLSRRAAEQAQSRARSFGYGGARLTDVDADESDVDTDPWRAATTATGARPAKPMAKKAVAKKTVAKKAVAKKAVASKVMPAGAAQPVAHAQPAAPAAKKAAKQTAPKKAAPKKAAKKAVPPPEEFG